MLRLDAYENPEWGWEKDMSAITARLGRLLLAAFSLVLCACQGSTPQMNQACPATSQFLVLDYEVGGGPDGPKKSARVEQALKDGWHLVNCSGQDLGHCFLVK